MKKTLFALALPALLALAAAASAQQPLLVDVQKGIDARIPIAVPPCATG